MLHGKMFRDVAANARKRAREKGNRTNLALLQKGSARDVNARDTQVNPNTASDGRNEAKREQQ